MSGLGCCSPRGGHPQTGRREGKHQGGGAGGLALRGEAVKWGRFSQEKGKLEGMEEIWPGSDQRCLAGRWKAGHGMRLEALRMETRRSLFPTRIVQLWSWCPSRSGLCDLSIHIPDG